MNSINEPSWCSPRRVWSTRPNYDQFDSAVWRTSLAADDVEVKERWRTAESDFRTLPMETDFEDRYIFQDNLPLKAMDYRMLAQTSFAAWSRDLTAVIRKSGNAAQLVTVGQDEGGTGERPNPHFHGRTVDFTTNHSWWLNDALLWDSVVTRICGVPNLLEETGIMFAERLDGTALRSEVECRNLLERKMAMSFAAGCSGFIQWLWNTNIYMDSDNEVGIGFLRADGTEKPELDAFRAVAKFMGENAHRMVERKPCEVAIVLPNSGVFSVRDNAVRATRRAVRVLEYRLGLPCSAVAEHEVEMAAGARWIIVPSPTTLTNACWDGLLQLARGGAHVLVTGFIDQDEYWRPVPRISLLGVDNKHAPVSRTEFMGLGVPPRPTHFTFGGDAIQKVEKAVMPNGGPLPFTVLQCGIGSVQFCPLPVELCDGESDTETLYGVGAAAAKLQPRAPGEAPPGLLAHRQSFACDDMWILVNESSSDVTLPQRNSAESVPALRVPAGRIAIAYVQPGTGAIVAKLEVE